MPPAADPVGQDSWEWSFKFMLFIGDLSSLILDSLVPLTSKSIFVLSRSYSSASIFLEREHVLMWKRLKAFLWFRLLRLWISSVSKYL